MTRYGAPLGRRPTSNTFTTWSLSICDAATPSLTKRSTAPGSDRTAGLMNLSATGRPPEEVRRLRDRAHAALAEEPLDPVLAVEDFARLRVADWSRECCMRGLREAVGPLAVLRLARTRR